MTILYLGTQCVWADMCAAGRTQDECLRATDTSQSPRAATTPLPTASDMHMLSSNRISCLWQRHFWEQITREDTQSTTHLLPWNKQSSIVVLCCMWPTLTINNSGRQTKIPKIHQKIHNSSHSQSTVNPIARPPHPLHSHTHLIVRFGGFLRSLRHERWLMLG